jgi:vacuolar-type H+-ATPase subunit E/Vma4
MTTFGSIEAVVAAIHEDAHGEIERIDTEAAAAVARLRDDDARTPVTVSDAETRIAAARRRAQERASEEDWADRQAALTAREQWLARVVALGITRLRADDPVTRRDHLARLAQEAVHRVGRPAVTLVVAPDDLPFADARWIDEVAAAAHATLTVAADPAIDGGCIARSPDGRLSYDNTYAARVRRFEAIWRPALSALYEGSTPGKPEGAEGTVDEAEEARAASAP